MGETGIWIYHNMNILPDELISGTWTSATPGVLSGLATAGEVGFASAAAAEVLANK